MLKLLNIFFYFITFIVLLNLQLIQSKNLRYLTKLSSKQIIINEQQPSNLITNKINDLHEKLIYAGLPVDLISSYLTAKEIYNYAHVNHATLNSPAIKDQYLEKIKEGYKFIDKTLNRVWFHLTHSTEELKTFLDTLPRIPTGYVTYVYNNGYRKAFHVLMKYNVTFDM